MPPKMPPPPAALEGVPENPAGTVAPRSPADTSTERVSPASTRPNSRTTTATSAGVLQHAAMTAVIRTDTQLTDSSDENEVREEDMGALINNNMTEVFGTGKEDPDRRGQQSVRLQSAFDMDNFIEGFKQKDEGRWSSSDGRDSEGRRPSMNSVSSVPSVRVSEELIKELFPPGSAERFQPQHALLPSVIHKIFGLPDNKIDDTKSNTSARSRAPSAPISCRDLYEEPSMISLVHFVRYNCFRLVGNGIFSGLMLVLTVYALYGPDFVALVATREQDDFFVLVNTFVFLVFFVEIVIMVCGKQAYMFSLPFVLDFTAFLSFLNDTWFMQQSDNAVGDEQSQRLAQMARSSRVTRVARVARVARVTRLVPKMMSIFGNQKLALARKVLLRRLWRAFRYLDTDRDEWINFFDLKCFYIAVLQECAMLFSGSEDPAVKAEMLRTDLPTLKSTDVDTRLNFDSFGKSLLSTAVGKRMVQYHLDDIMQEEGVWTLTQRLSDSTALKVCVGILSVVVCMAILNNVEDDGTVNLGLAHLQAMSKHFPAEDLCPDVEQFKALLAKSQQLLLFLVLGNYVFFDESLGNGCVTPSPISDAIPHLLQLYDAGNLRWSEVHLDCLSGLSTPSGNEEKIGFCRGGTGTLAYVDNRAFAREASIRSVLMTSVIIGLLLLFIMVFNRGITQFSKTLLQPLRALVDDMLAMSSLELVNIDADGPIGGAHAEEHGAAFKWMKCFRDRMPKGEAKPVEELQHLQSAFKGMKTSIRSWSKYVPPAVVQKLFAAGQEAFIGVVKTSATVLFCDIDGFEEACQSFSPTEVIHLLADVLNRIAEVVHNQRGTLLEYIESEVLAVYNTPNVIKNHQYCAALTALGIHQAISEMKPWVSDDGFSLRVRCRVGVHTAQILAGNVGSHQRMKYGLLGDGVNLTARLKGLTSRYAVPTILSEKMLGPEGDDMCKKKLTYRILDRVIVKGKTTGTDVFDLLGTSRGSDLEAGPQKNSAAKKHIKAFNLYLTRRWVEAKKLFEEVRDILEGLNGERDNPSRILIGRCARLIKNPPGDEWNGCEKLDKKVFTVDTGDDDVKASAPDPKQAEESKPGATRELRSLSVMDAHNLPTDEAPEVEGLAGALDKSVASNQPVSQRTMPQLDLLVTTADPPDLSADANSPRNDMGGRCCDLGTHFSVAECRGRNPCLSPESTWHAWQPPTEDERVDSGVGIRDRGCTLGPMRMTIRDICPCPPKPA